jgi:hypothetical protein
VAVLSSPSVCKVHSERPMCCSVCVIELSQAATMNPTSAAIATRGAHLGPVNHFARLGEECSEVCCIGGDGNCAVATALRRLPESRDYTSAQRFDTACRGKGEKRTEHQEQESESKKPLWSRDPLVVIAL